MLRSPNADIWSVGEQLAILYFIKMADVLHNDCFAMYMLIISLQHSFLKQTLE